MTKPKIAIIIGTTRQGRFADKPTAWVKGVADERTDADFEVLDLRDFPMPLFDEVASNAYAPSQNEHAVRWQQKLAEFDGFVFVTAEYNRAPSAVLKNALDYASLEWNRKPAAFVGYGSVGAAYAIGQLRQIAVELQMAPIRTAVYVQGADFIAAKGETNLRDIPHLQPGLKNMLDELLWWTSALKTARNA